MCSGCSEDPNTRLIAGTISTLQESTALFEQIAKTMNDAASQAESAGKPLALDKVEKALADADVLKQKAKILQNIKAEAERRKDNITADQRDEYSKKYRGDFQKAVADVDAAQLKLDVALRRAETVADDGGKRFLSEKLGKKLKDIQDEFEVLTKRQS